MADVIIRGVTYSGIDTVSIPADGGGTETFMQPSGAISITDNGVVDVTDYASAVVSVSGGGGGPTASDAILLVTVPAGSVVTATKGNETLVPTLWVSAADSTLEKALFVIDSSLFDSTPWTVTATQGADTASDTVLITTNKEYEVELSYRLYLYKRGDQCTSVTGGWSNSHGGGSGVRINTDNIEIYQIATSGRGASVYSTNQVDFTDYSTIHFIFTNTALGAYVKGGVSDVTVYTNATCLVEGAFPVSASEDELVVNISSITGLHYPRVMGGVSTLRIYEVWLE